MQKYWTPLATIFVGKKIEKDFGLVLDPFELHSVSFISNVYKQRFFQPVDFSEKNKQRTSWNQNVKQHPWNHLATKPASLSQSSNAREKL